MKIIISGATGLVGAALTSTLRDEGHSVARLVRAETGNAGDISWDPANAKIDLAPASAAAAGRLSGKSYSARVAWRRQDF
jgi:NAD dependent epimerase/dehydratase family enzyme